MAKAMRDARTSGSLAFGADKAKRIDLPPDRMLDPVSQAPLRGMITLQADRHLSRQQANGAGGQQHRDRNKTNRLRVEARCENSSLKALYIYGNGFHKY